MEGRRTPHTAFGRKLRDELERQNISVRELSRRINPADPEGARRSIARWLTDKPKPAAADPSPTSRSAVAGALGVPEEFFDEDDDEMPLSRETQARIVDVVARIVAEAIS